MTTAPVSLETRTGTGYGKLMVAGEYAVTRPLRRALVVTVDRRVIATVSPAVHPSVTVTSTLRTDEVSLEDLESTSLLAKRIEPENSYALRVLAQAAALARSAGAALPRGVDISIESQLDEPSGPKYGLGGSAAVTAALAAALNEFWALGLDRRGVWKLSYLATIETNPRASGADLAAAVYGGWLSYRSPDRGWLDDRLARHDVAALIHGDWPGLEIRTLPRPPDAGPLLVGWSGTPAVTAHLVATATARLTTDFLDRSDDMVSRLAEALSSGDHPATARYVGRAQSLLAELDTPAIGIMTDRLRTMLAASADLGVPAKISGAGGGDCCIAFPSDLQQHTALTQRWNALGFPVLPLGIASEAEDRHE
jgi:phosphomevalonate kinase